MAYFDEVFRDMELFQKRFLERMFREMEEIDKAVKSGKFEGGWDIRPIDRPGVKGYVAQGQFWSRGPWGIPKETRGEVREPLTDAFEDEGSVKLYVELPGVEKDDVQLHITEGKAEIKAKKFYKIIDLPTKDIDSEKASAKYKNGVLEVLIPKVKGTATDEKKQKIKIE